MTDAAKPAGDSAERTDDVLFEEHGNVGLITLSRPHARNALTLEMYEGLRAICAGFEPNGPIKSVIITGAGQKAFAAGTDISKFRDFKTDQDALDYEVSMDRVMDTVENVPLPTIAAIAGACTGGGAAIAACCDIRIATADLRFGFPIAKTLGNCLNMRNLSRLNALMGAGRVKEMLFTARLLGAQDAYASGFISEIVDDHDCLMRRAFELAGTLTEHAPLTLRATKEALKRLREVSSEADRDLITMCYGSEDFREGLEAFLAKRPARWQGK